MSEPKAPTTSNRDEPGSGFYGPQGHPNPPNEASTASAEARSASRIFMLTTLPSLLGHTER